MAKAKRKPARREFCDGCGYTWPPNDREGEGRCETWWDCLLDQRDREKRMSMGSRTLGDLINAQTTAIDTVYSEFEEVEGLDEEIEGLDNNF